MIFICQSVFCFISLEEQRIKRVPFVPVFILICIKVEEDVCLMDFRMVWSHWFIWKKGNLGVYAKLLLALVLISVTLKLQSVVGWNT